MTSAALIRRPDDMLSSPIGQHILDYEPPRGFFDGSVDPYDHMLHYNQAMILNVDNDRMLYKVLPASDECLKHSYYTRVRFMFLVDSTFK